jgi:shikimate dehydrogenase
MHTAALEALGLAPDWTYEAIDMRPADFEVRTRALPGAGFVGVNVTIPHKRAALELAGDASPAASEIGAANTLTFADGVIRADNTDAPGLLAAIERPVTGARALVLGAGGAARAAVWGLAREGADVEVWNRTGERADELVRSLASAIDVGLDTPRMAPVSGEQAATSSYDLIVNCTAVGLRDEDPFAELPLVADRLGRRITVVDLVYGQGDTPLVAEARRRRARVVDGIEVLVRQGAESLQIWTGKEPPLEVMREAARG